jgi:ectoine hydroxylase-related dioxygenase (phytanoyl-CoA dioxygenase family)
VVKPPQQAGPMSYSSQNGCIYSGLTRVVWELNPVGKDDGGTIFLSGTHKARFPFPPAALANDNPLMESYSCPAGSAFIFSESLLHASTSWRNRDTQRVSIFSAYNSVWAQWHKLNLDPAKIAAMPKKRQSLFRGVYRHDFHNQKTNCHWAPDNQAL